MKKHFIYGALAAMTMTACSQDEVTDLNLNGNEISYSVATGKPTRAANLFDNNTLPGSFKVWGNLNVSGDPYFAGDVVTKNGNKWESTNTRYWPAEALNFYAIAGCSEDLTVGTGNASFTYAVNPTVAGQEDVLYAAEIGATKDGGKVTLNFEHALSQIVFKAKKSNNNLHVVVSGVKVAHLKDNGTFTFTEETGTVFNEDETGTYSENNTNTPGSWANLDGNATYEIGCDAVTLTAAAQDLGGNAATAMLLMPQTTTAWAANATTGTFFAVKCQIYNVADPANGYQSSDICLWGESEPAYVYIPAAITWKPGKKYIYTFNFGNGNGGFEPDPTDPEKPDPDKPVLVPIEYDVTVDDFDIVSDTEINANATK